MDYKYDIFVSYKWGGARKEWVDNILVDILSKNFTEWVGKELLTPNIIFKDTDNIVPGATLDLSLQDALAHSKCMICVVSLPYFKDSSWCPTEFSAMLYRESQTGIRNAGNHTGFIFPIIFVEEKETVIANRSPVYEYPELRQLIFNFSPLELDYEKFNNTNEGFTKSAQYNELKNILRRWVMRSIKPTLQNIKNIPYKWKTEWATPEYILEPYEDFKNKYCSPPDPPPMPDIT